MSEERIREVAGYLVARQRPSISSGARVTYQLCIADSFALRRFGENLSGIDWIPGMWAPFPGAPGTPWRADGAVRAVLRDVAMHPGRPSSAGGSWRDLADEVIAM